MSAIDELLDPIEIPRMVRVRQTFDRTHLAAVDQEVLAQLRASGQLDALRGRRKVAVAVGSRGIAELPRIVKAVIDGLREIGTEPFIVPAMGSHGGATAAGQKAVLERLGVTESYTGAEIRSSMDTVQLGTTTNGLPVHMDINAASADATVIINRIHPHPAFRGEYESGLMKMLAIGLGKLDGANICHDLGFGVMHENVPAIGAVCLAHGTIAFAVAVIENAYHQVHSIHVVDREQIAAREPELLQLARRLEPHFPLPQFDVLVMNEIGKNISGAGFDPNIVGRYGNPLMSGGPRITKLAILDVTAVSHGNCMGIGLADFTTRKVFEQYDFEETYPNSLTSTIQAGIKIPMVLRNDRQAIQAAIKTCNIPDKREVRLAWIHNTLSMGLIGVSERCLDGLHGVAGTEICGAPFDIRFDTQGNIADKEEQLNGCRNVL